MERPTAATRNRPLMLKKCNIESLAPRSSRPELTKSSIIIFECLLNNCDSRVSISHCPCVLETYARTAGMKILRRMWLRCYGALLGAVKNSVRRLVRIRDVENRVAFQVPVAHCTSLQRSVLAGFPNATLKFLLMTKGNGKSFAGLAVKDEAPMESWLVNNSSRTAAPLGYRFLLNERYHLGECGESSRLQLAICSGGGTLVGWVGVLSSVHEVFIGLCCQCGSLVQRASPPL
uniref:Predicted protein n=1 Tax=Physcomitrium patens TaxID=3218 RepID=A9U440_PHYPA